jgi:hypothetical protein
MFAIDNPVKPISIGCCTFRLKDAGAIQPVNVEGGYYIINGLEIIFLVLRRLSPDPEDIFGVSARK